MQGKERRRPRARADDDGAANIAPPVGAKRHRGTPHDVRAQVGIDIASYERRYEPLFRAMRTDWAQLERGQTIQGALDLEAATGEPFCGDEPPQFFTGDLDASFVLVHLNPMAHGAEWARRHPWPVSFDEYVRTQRWFGRDHYGPGVPAWHSQFDHKQIRFLEPFEVIDFAAPAEDTRPANQVKLERVTDQKLQLELIPYRSPAFATSKIRRAGSLLDSHVLRLLSTVAAAPRDYVIFCGAIFSHLLNTQIAERVDCETFLRKRDGTKMRQKSRFTLMTLRTDGRHLQAGIAQSWARQGMPMDSYANWIVSLWHELKSGRPSS
jgi:hypothetical protein